MAMHGKKPDTMILSPIQFYEPTGYLLALLHLYAGRWWVNDPDCLLLRPNSGLTGPEVRGLATVKASVGFSTPMYLF